MLTIDKMLEVAGYVPIKVLGFNMTRGIKTPKDARDLIVEIAHRVPRPTDKEIREEVMRKRKIEVSDGVIRRTCKEAGVPTSSQAPSADVMKLANALIDQMQIPDRERLGYVDAKEGRHYKDRFQYVVKDGSIEMILPVEEEKGFTKIEEALGDDFVFEQEWKQKGGEHIKKCRERQSTDHEGAGIYDEEGYQSMVGKEFAEIENELNKLKSILAKKLKEI